MEILIRNLDKSVVRKIDDLAKAKDMKREPFLREVLTSLSILDEQKSLEERYKTLVEQQGKIIDLNTKVLNKVMEECSINLNELYGSDEDD